jgi:DNA mismatch repair protein MutS
MTPTKALLWSEFFMPATRPKPFVSVLFVRRDDQVAALRAAEPAFFKDLNLDQIVESVAAISADHAIKPFFYFPLRRIEDIDYRHEVFKDLQNTSLLDHVKSFAQAMREVRAGLTQSAKLYYRRHKQAWVLHSISIYCDAIGRLAADLSAAPIQSIAFQAFLAYLQSYVAGAHFTSLCGEADALTAKLAKVRYCVLITGNSFTVRNYDGESDYSAEVEEAFDKFKQGAAQNYLANYCAAPNEMNHIEAKILDFVAELNPDLFLGLETFCERNSCFIDEAIADFDREIQFYIAYLEHVATLAQSGLHLCFPGVCADSKTIYAHDAFDLALAQKLFSSDQPVVCNDFVLRGRERIIVVTGPNQGGKTTFARMFGQLHYLANLGCPVPARKAQLFIFDQLFTHFEREESVDTLRGKLQDDLVRIHHILRQVTPRSIVVMNEVFDSTTLQDQVFLSKKVMETLLEFDVIGVWVTFIEELASFSDQTVSMVGSIAPDDPTLRTFKIVRRSADGLAYALAIAQKYRLTYDQIKERIAS